MKVIHISESQPGSNDPAVLFEKGKIGLWATQFVEHLVDYYPKVDYEIWSEYCCTTYPQYERRILSEKRYNIRFVLFPAIRIGTKYISIPLLKTLNKLVKNNEKILVHLQSIHDVMPYMIAFLCRNVPLVAQQRGPKSPPMWRFHFRRNPIFLILEIINRLTLRYFDYIFASSLGESFYIRKMLGSDRVKHQKGGGFDFSRFQIRDRDEICRELGLNPKKRYLLHVGRLVPLKGVIVIIELFLQLKKERDDIELIFIGAGETHPLFEVAKESGAILVGKVPREEVIRYINATDVHLLPTEDKIWIPFGDIPTALIESLSMDQPVVSIMLMHFAGTLEERRRLGGIPRSHEDIKAITLKILNEPEKFVGIRQIMKKYYSWNGVIENNVKIYKKLFNEYYGEGE